MGINLVTFSGSTVTSQDDALIYETVLVTSGMIYGGGVTLKNANTLHVAAGHGAICGRKFTIDETDIPVPLTSTGTLNGRLYIHMDLSDADQPISLLVETASTLTPVVQDSDININFGVYEINLATFTVDTSTISSLVDVTPVLPPLKTAAQKDVPASGNATSGQVVMGNDSRLTNSRTPTAHASSASTYGLGSTTNYGHVKTINALTQSSHSDGTALSAYQGYVLNSAISNKVLYYTSVACSATTGNFVNYSNNAITANHVVAECVFANPSAITSDVTWTTAAGNIKLNGTCASATTVNLVLVKKDN